MEYSQPKGFRLKMKAQLKKCCKLGRSVKAKKCKTMGGFITYQYVGSKISN
jgi:hypothetical protein